jgi:UDP-N-acetyl-D-mannosaminuronic acid dehydrogenase
MRKKICIMGMGYIGLPTAAILAAQGNQVVGVDIDQRVVDKVNEGQIHIIEPNLAEIVQEARNSGNLRASHCPEVADIFIICVPTPFHNNEGQPTPNTDYIMAAAMAIVPFIKNGDTVILESTSPVGTTEKLAELLHSECREIDNIDIAYCPERVMPGNILEELTQNDRIIGGLTQYSGRRVAEFYKTFVTGQVIETKVRTAEMCKLIENSFRDVNIALANELSMICDEEDIDVWELIQLANRHPRVNILKPAVGVGGHCIAVDPWFIVARNPDNAKIILEARRVNNKKAIWVTEKIKSTISKLEESGCTNPTIACFGTSYKPDIDDLRESPALQIVQNLMNEYENICVVEPNINTSEEFHLVSADYALTHADLVVILVGHSHFKAEAILSRIHVKKYLDFCGLMS